MTLWDEPADLTLATRLNELHQLLYTRGGIRPVNVAVEELAKLLLMRIAAQRHPHMKIPGHSTLGVMLSHNYVEKADDLAPFKAAFTTVIGHREMRASVPGGETQPVWPLDEPLRITRLDILAEALDILGTIDLGGERTVGTVDPLGTAFDTFLQGKYAHSGGLGTYLTPATVATTMARIGFELAHPTTTTGLLGDPCCGTGRFLSAIVDAFLTTSPDEAVSSIEHRLIGADQSATSVAMARVNLLSYGARHPHVFTVEDSITDSHIDSLRGRFSLILMNPPFGENKYDSVEGIARTERTLASQCRGKIDPSVGFVGRVIELLEPNGVAGIILPDGILDGAFLRTALLDPNFPLHRSVGIEGVISLPTAAFAPAGTVAKTSVMFIRKAAEKRSSVFMARCDHVGYLLRKGNTVQDPDGDDLPRIVDQVQRLLRGDETTPISSDLVAMLPMSELTSLDASSYDIAAIDARAELTRRGGVEFSQYLTTGKKRRTGKKVQVDGPFISVLHVDPIGNVDWADAVTYKPTTPGIVAAAGDVIVSLLNPSKFRACVVPERYPLVECSAEFGVFTPKINPYVALAMLQHPLTRAQIAPLGRGTSSSRRRIDAKDVLGLIAPPFDAAVEEEFGEKIRTAFDAIAQGRDALAGLFADDL
jgi:hypothetical protein